MSDDVERGTSTATSSAWSPKIVAFVCNWCTYTGADLAGTSRLKMDPNVRVIRLTCSSRVNPLFIIKAFERGADGVVVSGCHTGDCHYSTGNYYARRRFAILHDLLDFMGVATDRVTFSWVSASEGNKWQELVNETTHRVKALGPFHEFQDMTQKGGECQ
jgi:F420-non-reducing hydrogenase iron-sulfur subunit